MKKGVYFLLVFMVIAAAAAVFFIFRDKIFISPEEKACINSGGTISTLACCKSIVSFPNTCTMGSCGCSPAASHRVKSCVCENGKCFNGTMCVVQGFA